MMRKLHIMFLAAVSFYCGPGAMAAEEMAPAEPRRAVIPRLSGELKVDGRLDEPVWQSAVVLKPFFPNSGTGRDSESTEVRAWYDGAKLYLGWKCEDRDIQVTMKARDSKFWEEEVAEFFIAPVKLEEYFELQWNPLGGIFDAIIRNRIGEDGKSIKFQGEWGYTAKGMTAAVKMDGTAGDSSDRDVGWTVEAAIPFSDLKMPTPKPGTVWRGNFYRFSRGSNNPEQQLSWSPTRLPGFHEPTRFGYLEFGP